MALEDNNWIPAAVFGGSLVLLGSGMMVGHVRAWQKHRHDESLSDLDQQQHQNRYRRRMQTSSAVAFVGGAIGLGDVFIWRFGPLVAAVYWLVVTLLGCWITLLALGDLTAVRSHSQTMKAQLDSRRKALEAELTEHRRRNNGQSIKD